VLDWLRDERPDLLALQELKTTEEDFPAGTFADAGYEPLVHGQKTWNGVALLSRQPLDRVEKGIPELGSDPEARVISANLKDVRIINVYVPNGAVVGSEKYVHKLRWLDALAEHIEARFSPNDPVLIVGDFNIAPEGRDIYDPVLFRDQVLFSEPERAALKRLLDWGFVDLFRRFHDGPGLYSWWDYRAAAFRRNLGARLDLILATRPLAERAVSCRIDVGPRRLEKTSDHTPVLATFA